MTGVALLGRAGSGKTFFADALVKCGAVDARASFAAELKADLAELDVVKGQPFARECLIAYGQNKRAMNPDYWIERLDVILRGDWHGLAVDDVRFPNEVAWLRSKGYLIVRLSVPAEVRQARGISEAFSHSTDASETALDDTPVDLTMNTEALGLEMSCLAVMAALGVPA